MRYLLEETQELRKLGIRNMKEINAESLEELISMISDLIQSQPPNLTELDFCGIGGSHRQGNQILGAIYRTEIQIKKLDISDNPKWAQNGSYS